MLAVRFPVSPKGRTLPFNFPSLILCVAVACATGVSQDHQAPAPQENPQQLVSQVVANELKAQQTDHSLWRYRQIQHQGSGTQEMEFVQTSVGSIHRLVRRNGRALNPDEVRQEDSRISQLVAHPDSLRKREKEEEKDGQETAELLRILPEALNYRYEGTNNGVVMLEFTPNPSYRAHRHQDEVFHHMSGRLLVDASQKRIVEINGRLMSEVKFGGGFLGHLDKGGTFIVNEKDVGNGHWEMTRLFINMNGRALFFKTIDVHEDQQDTDFQSVPEDITLQQAAELLHRRTPEARREQHQPQQ